MSEIHLVNYGENSGVGAIKTVPFGIGNESVRVLLVLSPTDDEGEFDFDITSDIPVTNSEVPSALGELLEFVAGFVNSEEFAEGWASSQVESEEKENNEQ